MRHDDHHERNDTPQLDQALHGAKEKNEARDCSINICAIDCKGGVGVVINKGWRGMKTDSINPPARSPPFGLPHVIKPSPTRMGPTMHLPQTSGGQMRVDLSG